MTYMKLKNIKIKDSYAVTVPKAEKLLKCKEHWEKNHTQDRYLTIDHNYNLIDGYIQYLVLKDAGVDTAEVKISDKRKSRCNRKIKQNKPLKKHKYDYKKCNTLYVFGVQINSTSTKERIWRVPNSWKDTWIDFLKTGDYLLVNTKRGASVIKITRIEMFNKCPVEMPVKKVIRKLDY